MKNIMLFVLIILSYSCTSIKYGKKGDYNYILEDTFLINFEDRNKHYKIYLEYPEELVKSGGTITQKLIDKKITVKPYFEGRFDTRINYRIIKEKKFSNKFIYLNIPQNIARNLQKIEIRAQYKVYRKEFKRENVSIPRDFLSKINQKKFRKFLVAERYVPITAYYKNLASKIISDSDNDYEKLYSIYKYVANHGKYYKLDIARLKPSGIGSSKYCDVFGTGNCTDYHAYFTSLARAVGFPVRQITGAYLNPENNGKDTDNGYHCWVEIYIPIAGWLPLDPAWGNFNSKKKEYYFFNLEKERIVFTTGRNFFLPYSNYLQNLFIFASVLVSEDGKRYNETKTFTRKLRFWVVDK